MWRLGGSSKLCGKVGCVKYDDNDNDKDNDKYNNKHDDNGNDNGNNNDNDLPAGFEMKMETMKKTREAANQR